MIAATLLFSWLQHAAPHLRALASCIAWLIALAWLWKFLGAARGLPRIPNLCAERYNRTPEGSPAITVIVPARNEAEHIAATLESLLAQDYPAHIIAVDDRSTDQTGAIADALAAQHPDRLTTLHIATLPEGWLGKTHAMALAARHALALHHPGYLLFTDADVLFDPTAIRRTLAEAVATQADHFVTFPTPLVKTAGEGMMLGFLQVMGLWVTRPWLAANPQATRDAIGIGAFCLVKPEAYQQVGGFEALRLEVLEDVNFARNIKKNRLRQRVAIAPGMVSLHWAAGAMGIVHVMTKNLFAVFNFRLWLMLLAAAGIKLLTLLPFFFLFFHATRLPAVLTLACIAGLYILSARHSRISPWYAILFPAGAVMFLISLLRSTTATLRQGGVIWRGTFYPLTELRKSKP